MLVALCIHAKVSCNNDGHAVLPFLECKVTLIYYEVRAPSKKY